MQFLKLPFSPSRKEEDDVLGAALQLSRVLLQGIRLHAVEAVKEDHTNFQAEIQKLEAGLGDKPSAGAALVVAGAADQALRDYNRQVTKFIRAERLELERMISSLAATLTAVSNGSERAVSSLQTIGWRLAKASEIEDIRLIGLQLSECLQALKEETLRQKEDAAKTITHLKSVLDKQSEEKTAASASALAETSDPVTGLAGRGPVEEAIEAALREGSHTFVVVFVLKALQSLNTRLGRSVGDEALKLFSRELLKRLPSPHRVYRWGGPCFIVLVDRPDPMGKIEEDIARVNSRRLELAMETEGRFTIIPLSSKASIIPLFTTRSLEALKEKVELFISTP